MGCAHTALAVRPSANSLGPNKQFSFLDTAAIHALYMDGEFEPAIDQLERASAEGVLKSHSDSVFAYKHLGVMYAARYETMEKGKSYMYRLLTIEPSVKILDMYASEMIYMIFRNVQAEFEVRTARPKTSASTMAHLVPVDSAERKQAVAKSRFRTWPYWTAGAFALVGVGMATYFLIEDVSPSSNHYDGGF